MTDDNYWKLVEQVPDQHPLKNLLKKGNTALNRMRVLKLASEQPVADQDDEQETDEDLDVDPLDVDDPVMRGLFIEKSNLFVLRAKQSNKLHDCATDYERAQVMEKILAIQGDIEVKFRQIREYRANGRLNEVNQFPVPEDGTKLILLLNSVRANISQLKSKIKKLYHTEKRTPEQDAKMKNWDETLQKHERHKKVLENAVKERRITDLQSD